MYQNVILMLAHGPELPAFTGHLESVAQPLSQEQVT